MYNIDSNVQRDPSLPSPPIRKNGLGSCSSHLISGHRMIDASRIQLLTEVITGGTVVRACLVVTGYKRLQIFSLDGVMMMSPVDIARSSTATARKHIKISTTTSNIVLA